MKKFSIIFIAFVLFLSTFPPIQQANASTQLGSKFFDQNYTIAPGVNLKKENFESGNIRRAINYMTVDMNTANVSLNVAMGQPFNRFSRITEMAHRDTVLGTSHVVGTINASFYATDGSQLPVNLVAQNNQILHFGRLSPTANDPISQRFAFGINANGGAMIDSYREELQVHVNGRTLPFHSINNGRNDNQMTLFTPSFHSQHVPLTTNNDAIEIVVTNVSKDTRTLSFGDRITGTVSAITRNNQGPQSAIPRDGFVLVANGSTIRDQYTDLQVGQELSISLSIDQKWMNSQSMIATGPLLVRDGAVSISMNETSSFASSRHPRSAVGITRDNRLMLVTVDGRQAGFSDGISLRDLANYMISLGAVAAINLDGGGSTGMAARIAGNDLAYLVNRPSDGQERRVTNAIQIVSTTPAIQVTQSIRELESFRNVNNWFPSFIRGSGSLTASASVDPAHPGNRFLRLSYDFTTDKNQGTSAAYAVAKQPILLEGMPKKIGMWVHGDGKENWLRLQLTDRDLGTHVVNFTVENGLNWYGWRYVTADIPQDLKAPLSISRIYIAQTREEKKSRGTIYIDKIDAVYDISIQAPTGTPPIPQWRFSDVPSGYWAAKEIAHLVDQKVITGFPDGTFRPGANVTREQVATLLVRQLKLSTANRPNPNFNDVPTTNDMYAAIATVAELGIMTGREEGYFHPKESLTRAEAAEVLRRAYELTGGEGRSFPDVPPGHWAHSAVQALIHHNITTGFPDGRFAPAQTVTRAEFSAFLYRASVK